MPLASALSVIDPVEALVSRARASPPLAPGVASAEACCPIPPKIWAWTLWTSLASAADMVVARVMLPLLARSASALPPPLDDADWKIPPLMVASALAYSEPPIATAVAATVSVPPLVSVAEASPPPWLTAY